MRRATFFSAGFGRYLDSGEFGDVVLEAAEGNERFVAHRLVLGYSSAHFARLLLHPKSSSSSVSGGAGDDGRGGGGTPSIPSPSSAPSSSSSSPSSAAHHKGRGGGSPPVSPLTAAAAAGGGGGGGADDRAGLSTATTPTKRTTSSYATAAGEEAAAGSARADGGGGGGGGELQGQGTKLKNSTSVKTIAKQKKKEKKEKNKTLPRRKKKDKEREKEKKEKEKEKDRERKKAKDKQKAKGVDQDIDQPLEEQQLQREGECEMDQGNGTNRTGGESDCAKECKNHPLRVGGSGLSKSADALHYKGGSIKSRRARDDPVSSPQTDGEQKIPEPPPPPVRLARRATGSGIVVLPRPYALKDAPSIPHHHSLAITRSLSGSTDRSSVTRKGGSIVTGSSFTPRSSFSSSCSALSLAGDTGEAGSRGKASSEFLQDEIIYSSPEPKRGHERHTTDEQLPVIQLDFPDPNRIFPSVLRFMYEGYIEIMPENAIPLLAMADHYCIEILKKLCSDYVIANIDRENALWMLERAMLYSAEEIIKTCVNVIARNFSYIYNANYNVLPYELLISILEHPCLAVKAMGEWALFQIIRDYITQHPQLKPEEKYRLYSSVRYRWMTTDELAQLQTANVVPSDLIIEALMERLKDAERDKHPDESSKSLDQGENTKNSRLLPRPSFGILFDYAYDYDKKGVIFWIATNRGREPWNNPHSTGTLRVTASSIEKGDPVKLVSQKPSELWSGDVPASWFAIDLGSNRTLVPNYYTLRHGGNYKADSLRTWDLQGSTDGKHWVVLRRHANDTSLSGPFATHSWPISAGTEAYRHFRILQTGHNSSNHNFLVLSGVEFYGELFET